MYCILTYQYAVPELKDCSHTCNHAVHAAFEHLYSTKARLKLCLCCPCIVKSSFVPVQRLCLRIKYHVSNCTMSTCTSILCTMHNSHARCETPSNFCKTEFMTLESARQKRHQYLVNAVKVRELHNVCIIRCQNREKPGGIQKKSSLFPLTRPSMA